MPKHLDIDLTIEQINDDVRRGAIAPIKQSVKLAPDIYIGLLKLCKRNTNRPVTLQLADFLQDYWRIKETTVVVSLDGEMRKKLKRLAGSMGVTQEQAMVYLLSACK